MGLKGVCTLINKLAPSSIIRTELTSLRRSTIAIDTSILLYRFSYVSRENLILSFAKLCVKYLGSGIQPVFIFDGPPPKCKNGTLDRRFKNRQKVRDSIVRLKKTKGYSKKELFRLQKQLVYVSKEDKQRVFEFLRAFGFDTFTSPGEAETMCAFLQREGIVDYTYTDDSDAFALGCNVVLRNFNNGKFDKINMDIVLNQLRLTKKQFIDMCILCGCDYCPPIPHINYNNAYNLISKHKTIENVLAEISRTGEYVIPDNYNYEEAREAFTNFSKFVPVKLPKRMVIDHGTVESYNGYLDKSLVNRLKLLTLRFHNGFE